jgi:Flp pilus assembly protein TadD
MSTRRVKSRHRACLRWASLSALLSLALVAHAVPTAAKDAPRGALSVHAVDSEPKNRKRPTEVELAALRENVANNPKLRKPRLELVRALMASGDLSAAHQEAEAWREHDAYNLVVVRLLGDIENELGDKARARRTYSAIVELLPRDVEARRALSTVLKQAGDMEGARTQLLSALGMEKSDPRIVFELGDVEQRLGMEESARARFESTRDAAEATEALRYPARQRLAQIHGRALREARARGDRPEAQRLSALIDALAIRGGNENDVKVYLSWDSDRTDVDLWVTTPAGEKVFYGNRNGSGGEALFDDVTTGYGPESFTAPRAQAGDYLVQVNYFGSGGGALKDARGEVMVVLNEGRPSELRQVFPYRLFEPNDVVTVARIHVEPRT